MLTDGGAKLLEYNVRFGDPETQSILVRLDSDLVDICEAMLNGTLGSTQIKWREGNSACVVLAAEGYPQKPRTGDAIHGLDKTSAIDDVTIFHAGTSLSDDGALVTAGGRVLGVTANGNDLADALRKAYDACGPHLVERDAVSSRHR
jgi:phosphoribosylamine--glycine ligase